jgi:hypothetical protein
MLLALYLCVFLGFKESCPTDILCTHGQNNVIYHIKKKLQYVFWNLRKCIIFKILYICVSQKKKLFIQICPLANFETKVRHNTDNHGIQKKPYYILI